MKSKSGFTIMELMIAVTVLSVMLLLSTYVLMGIGSSFSKGVNDSNIQNYTRNTTQDIVSTLQFSGGTVQTATPASFPTYSINAICIGNIRYSFVTGIPTSSSSFTHPLWKDRKTDGSKCEPLDLSKNPPSCNGGGYACTSQGEPLLGSNVYIGSLSVTPIITSSSTSTYQVIVGLALGDQSLFVSGANGPSLVNGNYQCQDSTGQQFCATSMLTTDVNERISQ